MDESVTIKGVVKWFDRKKGYGYIYSDTKVMNDKNEWVNEFFAHYSNIVSPYQFKVLSEGEEVAFKVVQTERGLMAIDIYSYAYFHDLGLKVAGEV